MQAYQSECTFAEIYVVMSSAKMPEYELQHRENDVYARLRAPLYRLSVVRIAYNAYFQNFSRIVFVVYFAVSVNFGKAISRANILLRYCEYTANIGITNMPV